MGDTRWQPILDAADAARARAAIVTLAGTPSPRDASLAGGWAGVALLHAYLAHDARARGDGAAEDAAIERLHDALGAALGGVGELGAPWLAGGVIGVAWTCAHAAALVELDDDVLATFDGVAAAWIARDAAPYELLHGLVGIGLYARERGRDDLVAGVVAQLERRADRGAAGASWWTPADEPTVDPRGYRDLGAAHGATGAIAFCARACADGVGAARPLLDEAVAWLLAQARADAAPAFPPQRGLVRPDPVAYDGWCYGDLPIACALCAAGAAAGRADWIDRARAIAHASAARTADHGLSLCHGTAGRAHLLHRLARALGDAVLLSTSRHLHLGTLARLPDAAIAEPGVLDGTTGVALALLGAVSTIEPRWDGFLAIDLG